jgi:lipid II:glycine glycyltransferase (peptidoglycan interpeptide bridge formation enzyme)
MIRNLSEKSIDQVYQTPVLQQTAYWSKVKNRLGIESLALNFKVRSDSVVNIPEYECKYHDSDLLILIQRVDSESCFAYVPYGPEVEPTDELTGAFLEDLSEQLLSYLPANCIFIRYDLLWKSLWDDEIPENQFQELRINIGTNRWNLRKAYTNILPSSTIFLNLRKDSKTLLSGMKYKTRYNIILSERKGVEIRCAGIESLEIWYDLYKETAIRNSFYLHSIEYFKTILSVKANDTASPAYVTLLIAEREGTPLAAMFHVVSGKRATYLYGASSSLNRSLMAPYALQWYAINYSKQMGCTEYDLFGISPTDDKSHPLHGLYRFKNGFGGEIHHSLGCWDYPINNELYKYYTAMEMQSQGFHVSL